MQSFSFLLKAIFRVCLLSAIGFSLGWLLGNALLGLILALMFALVWHIYSGQWLSNQIKKKQSIDNSLLPLTIEDSRISDSIILRDKALFKSEKEKARLEKMLRVSAEALPAGIVVINQSNRVQWANSKANSFIGVRDPEDIGQPVDNLLRHPQFTSMLKRKAKILNDVDDIQIISPINDQIYLRISLNRYAKRLRLITIEDITAFHRVNKMRQDFIGNASHELRTPLTVIRGYLEEFIDDEAFAGEWQAPLLEINKQVYRTQDILEDMLALSRLESRPRLAGDKQVDLTSVVRQAVTDLSQASAHTHNMMISMPENLLLRGDESELYSVVSNLIKNALHYSPAGTEISINWQQIKGQEEARLSICDQGIGIPEESLVRLTERFYRVDHARSTEMGGTGLGLAIVKHALMRHESRLDIESVEGEGSCFICCFPTERIC